MKVIKTILVGVTALILLIAVGVYIFLQTTKPVYSGEQKMPGLISEVEILYDDYGVPHIYAQHEEDAYYALGYAHAQDRLFQMEMIRRAASGRLSEILGPDFVKIDKLFRTLGIHQFAKEHAQKFLSTDTAAYQKGALAYQKGINQFIKIGKTPLEFSIIGIPKKEFKPEDIYLAVGFMSFGFAEGLRADPVLQKIKDEYGAEVKFMAPKCDLVIVVGSPNSSNSNRLREVAETMGTTAYMIDRADQLSPAWLAGKSRVGVTAGASAPEILVQDVIERLRELGAKNVRKLDGIAETVTFPLPKGLARASTFPDLSPGRS